MIFLVIWLWVYSFGLLDLNLAPWISNLSAPLHHWCLDQIPQDSRWKEFYGAIVCGSTPPASPEKFWFQTTGLYHLLVISGSHLIFLSQWLKPFAKNLFGKIFLAAFLAVYSLICLGSPPVMRALIHLLLGFFPLQSRLSWTSAQKCMLTGVVALSLFPNWTTSLSFWLSWLASMLCAWADRFTWPQLHKIILIQSLLLPGFGFSNSNLAVTVIGNWLLGSILGKYLFGCALLATLVPQFSVICDWLWLILIRVLGAISHFAPVDSRFSTQILILLIYVSVLNLIWIGWEQWQKRLN